MRFNGFVISECMFFLITFVFVVFVYDARAQPIANTKQFDEQVIQETEAEKSCKQILRNFKIFVEKISEETFVKWNSSQYKNSEASHLVGIKSKSELIECINTRFVKIKLLIVLKYELIQINLETQEKTSLESCYLDTNYFIVEKEKTKDSQKGYYYIVYGSSPNKQTSMPCDDVDKILGDTEKNLMVPKEILEPGSYFVHTVVRNIAH